MLTFNIGSAERMMALMFVAILASPGSANAQMRDGADGPVIVVEAPRSVRMSGERSPYTGAPIVVTTIKIPALYGDLDLAKPSDAARLLKRLDRVAHDACKQLDRLFPLNPDPDCVGRAVVKATVTAKSVIAAAKAKRAKLRRP